MPFPFSIGVSLSFNSPAARACTFMLPIAVASTGPATTLQPVFCAVSLFNSAFCEPPPTMYMVVIRRPVDNSNSCFTLAYSFANDRQTNRFAVLCLMEVVLL